MSKITKNLPTKILSLDQQKKLKEKEKIMDVNLDLYSRTDRLTKYKSSISLIEVLKMVSLEVGKALSVIAHENLYKQEYKTFEKYLNERWDMSSKTGISFIRYASLITQGEYVDVEDFPIFIRRRYYDKKLTD